MRRVRGNIRMQLSKVDGDRACHSFASVSEDMVPGQRTEQKNCNVRDLKCFRAFNKAHFTAGLERLTGN